MHNLLPNCLNQVQTCEIHPKQQQVNVCLYNKCYELVCNLCIESHTSKVHKQKKPSSCSVEQLFEKSRYTLDEHRQALASCEEQLYDTFEKLSLDFKLKELKKIEQKVIDQVKKYFQNLESRYSNHILDSNANTLKEQEQLETNLKSRLKDTDQILDRINRLQNLTQSSVQNMILVLQNQENLEKELFEIQQNLNDFIFDFNHSEDLIVKPNYWVCMQEKLTSLVYLDGDQAESQGMEEQNLRTNSNQPSKSIVEDILSRSKVKVKGIKEDHDNKFMTQSSFNPAEIYSSNPKTNQKLSKSIGFSYTPQHSWSGNDEQLFSSNKKINLDDELQKLTNLSQSPNGEYLQTQQPQQESMGYINSDNLGSSKELSGSIVLPERRSQFISNTLKEIHMQESKINQTPNYNSSNHIQNTNNNNNQMTTGTNSQTNGNTFNNVYNNSHDYLMINSNQNSSSNLIPPHPSHHNGHLSARTNDRGGNRYLNQPTYSSHSVQHSQTVSFTSKTDSISTNNEIQKVPQMKLSEKFLVSRPDYFTSDLVQPANSLSATFGGNLQGTSVASTAFVHFISPQDKVLYKCNIQDKKLKWDKVKFSLGSNCYLLPGLRTITLPNGEIYILNCLGTNTNQLKMNYNSIFMMKYDMKNNLIVQVSKNVLQTSRNEFSLAYANQCIFVIGGQNFPTNEVFKECQVFDLQTMNFRSIEDMNHPAASPGVCSFNENYIFQVGGTTQEGPLNEYIERYDIRKNSWLVYKIEKNPNLKVNFELLAYSCCAQINSRCILVFGGTTTLDDPFDKDQSYLLEIQDDLCKATGLNQLPVCTPMSFINPNPIIFGDVLYAMGNVREQNKLIPNQRKILTFNFEDSFWKVLL